MGRFSLAPSSMKRILKCTASPHLIEALPDIGKESKYADEGTNAHSVAASLLYEGYCNLPPCPPVDKPSCWDSCDDDMYHSGEAYRNYVMDLVDPTNGVLYIEKEVPRWYDGGKAIIDALVYNPSQKVVHLVDYKYGKGVKVDIIGNEQLWIYAASVLSYFGRIWDIEGIINHIHQPRIHNVIEESIITDDLIEFKNRVDQTILGIEAKETKFAPSIDACRWCNASGRCAAQAKHAWGVMRGSKVDSRNNTYSTLPNHEDMSLQDLSRVIQNKGFINKWLGDTYDTALLLAKEGAYIPDHKLVQGKGDRTWLDEGEAEKHLRKKLSRKEVFKEKLLSPNQAYEALKTVEVSKRFETQLEEQIHRPMGAYKLVPDADKREDVNEVEFDILD